MYNCHGMGGNQIFSFSKDQTIGTLQEFCLGVDGNQHQVISSKCRDNEHQWWQYNKQVEIF